VLTDLPAPISWSNWVGNQSFTPRYAAAPGDEEELATLVSQASARGVGVRVAGSGHSFTAVVQTDGLLLDLSALRGVVGTDSERKCATVLGGTPIRDLYEPLWRDGLALRNQGDIDTQQIAGAVATATHGSGIGYTSLSGVVRGVQLLTAAGEIRDIGEDQPELLRAAQVAVGMLGVMTRLELEVTDAYRLTEQVHVWPWEEVIGRWERVSVLLCKLTI